MNETQPGSDRSNPSQPGQFRHDQVEPDSTRFDPNNSGHAGKMSGPVPTPPGPVPAMSGLDPAEPELLPSKPYTISAVEAFEIFHHRKPQILLGGQTLPSQRLPSCLAALSFF